MAMASLIVSTVLLFIPWILQACGIKVRFGGSSLIQKTIIATLLITVCFCALRILYYADSHEFWGMIAMLALSGWMIIVILDAFSGSRNHPRRKV